MPDLLICVEGSASDEEASLCRALFDSLAEFGWTHQPVRVDQVDEIPGNDVADLPAIRTAGVAVQLPDAGSSADEHAVRRDVARLVEAASGFAGAHGIEFVVEYDREEIGSLDGSPDDARLTADFFGSS